MNERETYEYYKPIMNKRVDVLFRDPNPKWDDYCQHLIDNCLDIPAGGYTVEEWEAELDKLRALKVKVKDVIWK